MDRLECIRFNVVKLIQWFALEGLLKVSLPQAKHKVSHSNVVVHDDNVHPVQGQQKERLKSGHLAVVNALVAAVIAL